MNAVAQLEQFIDLYILEVMEYDFLEANIEDCTVEQLQHLRTLTNAAILEKLEKKHGSVYKKIVGEDND